MTEHTVQHSKDLKEIIDRIERFLKDKKYKEALAEIRDFESNHKTDLCPSLQQSEFNYLKATTLRFLGDYNDALLVASKAFLFLIACGGIAIGCLVSQLFGLM